MTEPGTLIFFCGKMGAGKSTMAEALASELDAILLSEDEWLSALYPEEIRGLDDYVKYSARLKPLLRDHVRRLLRSGLSVVMDFPANTKKQRAWFREIVAEGDFPHRLIHLDVDDAVCLAQIRQRRERHPERARFDTEEMFRKVTSYFDPPSAEEGLSVEIVRRD